MSWQDWVLTISGVMLLVSLVPTIRGEQKPAVATSVLNVVIVLVISLALASFGLWFSVVTNVCIAVAWSTLAVQRLRQPRTVSARVVANRRRREETA